MLTFHLEQKQHQKETGIQPAKLQVALRVTELCPIVFTTLLLDIAILKLSAFSHLSEAAYIFDIST
ncbi:hypothetical protein Hanom_Chr08g00721711 [Helianthus anomalus]